MMNEYREVSAVHVLLRRGDEIVISLRSNTGFMDGYYSLPTGVVVTNETYSEAASRELLEETGVEVSPDDMSFVYLQHRKEVQEDGTIVIWSDIFFDAGDPGTTQPTNIEAKTHDNMSWCLLNDLPENMIPLEAEALSRINQSMIYGEYGWTYQ